jgi:hypothetical protein
LSLAQPAPASAAVSDGRIELSGGKVAAGVGYTCEDIIYPPH